MKKRDLGRGTPHCEGPFSGSLSATAGLTIKLESPLGTKKRGGKGNSGQGSVAVKLSPTPYCKKCEHFWGGQFILKMVRPVSKFPRTPGDLPCHPGNTHRRKSQNIPGRCGARDRQERNGVVR